MGFTSSLYVALEVLYMAPELHDADAERLLTDEFTALAERLKAAEVYTIVPPGRLEKAMTTRSVTQSG